VARSSLVLGLLAMSTTGCLITSTPQFKPLQHTKPFLIARYADPPVSMVQMVNIADPGSVQFSAEVISQDDLAGSSGPFQTVSAWLWIDYGDRNCSGDPFRWAFPSTMPALLPSSLDQTERNVSVTWFEGSYPVEAGCHTATLVASHKFEPNGCPSCDDDYTMITWQVLGCNPSTDGCASLPVSEGAGCAAWLNSVSPNMGCAPPSATCEEYHMTHPSTCPEQMDGGAP
jgi:hypothetical protein